MLRVLIVDDEPDLANSLCLGLRARGHQTWAAYDGAGALAIFDGHADDIDLVIADYAMPDLDGISLLKALKQEKDALPVIIITANRTKALIRSAAAHGCLSVLAKPFGIERIIQEIERIDTYSWRAHGSIKRQTKSDG